MVAELMLSQAGLGKRTINIPEDAGHKQVYLLCEVYPKMRQPEGAGMLYKAMGGLGQRKLILVPPDNEGYTGTCIIRTGKSWLYILPILHTLDTTPLPMSAPEFQAIYVPLQLLGLHVKECSINNEIACPLCCQPLTKEEICAHTGVYILVVLEKRVDASMTFNISVTREDLQKKASPKNLLLVSFIGEHQIDEGALRKEFLTEIMRGIKARYFEGDGEKGKIPKYRILDYQDQNFKYTCGEILATSLAQGGPAPNILKTWCYNFLCHGEMEIDVPPDATAQDLINLKAEVPTDSSRHNSSQFLTSLNKFQLLWYIHANDSVQFSALCYIINCLCHVDQNVLYSSLSNSLTPQNT
uniref:HECT domain-containing protein n=1 Tax=Oryzias sinensis TaxID=183150 RepID=A0A8C7WY03_9TELE